MRALLHHRLATSVSTASRTRAKMTSQGTSSVLTRTDPGSTKGARHLIAVCQLDHLERLCPQANTSYSQVLWKGQFARRIVEAWMNTECEEVCATCESKAVLCVWRGTHPPVCMTLVGASGSALTSAPLIRGNEQQAIWL
jgi:hypothetical protein